MAISEKVQLLGGSIYTDIPPILTIRSLPTVSELDYVGNEDFDDTMLDTILPQAVEEKIDFRRLLEIDYEWLCRCLRILNYGPYFTTNLLLCDNCRDSFRGEYQVDLRTIGCTPLPEGFKNDVVIEQGRFIDFKGDVHLRMLTIQDVLNYNKDKAFKRADGKTNTQLARICYSITSLGTEKGLTPLDVRMKLSKDFSPADYVLLKQEVQQLTDYGLRAAGTTVCPRCQKQTATFLAFSDDKFFRPTMGDIREWAKHRSERSDENTKRSKKEDV